MKKTEGKKSRDTVPLRCLFYKSPIYLTFRKISQEVLPIVLVGPADHLAARISLLGFSYLRVDKRLSYISMSKVAFTVLLQMSFYALYVFRKVYFIVKETVSWDFVGP
jgi:hypothetical protein